MKIYVFGANGFVGTALSARADVDFVLFDNFFLKKPLSPNVQKLCIANEPGVVSDLFRAETESFIVVNLAAIHYIPYCNSNPGEAFVSNVLGNLRLMEALRDTKCVRYVFASSGAVYHPSFSVHTEDDFVCSSDTYSASKISAECDAQQFSASSGISVEVLRFFNIVGRGDYTPHLIPEMYDQIVGADPFIQHGNLSSVRDYIHVDDVVDAILALCRRPLNGGARKFNVCTGIGTSGFDVVAMLKRLTGCDKPLLSDEMRFRISDRPHQVGRFDKLSRETGWVPRFSLSDALNDYISFRRGE